MNHGLWVLYGLCFVALLMSAHDHGKPRTGTENFWITICATVVHLAVVWWALDWKLY